MHLTGRAARAGRRLLAPLHAPPVHWTNERSRSSEAAGCAPETAVRLPQPETNRSSAELGLEKPVLPCSCSQPRVIRYQTAEAVKAASLVSVLSLETECHHFRSAGTPGRKRTSFRHLPESCRPSSRVRANELHLHFSRVARLREHMVCSTPRRLNQSIARDADVIRQSIGRRAGVILRIWLAAIALSFPQVRRLGRCARIPHQGARTYRRQPAALSRSNRSPPCIRFLHIEPRTMDCPL